MHTDRRRPLSKDSGAFLTRPNDTCEETSDDCLNTHLFSNLRHALQLIRVWRAYLSNPSPSRRGHYLVR